MVEKTVYLSLGSNVGDRAKNLRAAIDELPHAGVAVKRMSSFYETEPVDLREQPWFLNCAAEVETRFDAIMLLRALREIETKMGSMKLVAKGPRLIDMDILLYGAETIDTPELQVPHPRMHLRRFVLVPLAEIAPELVHPVLKKSATRLLVETPDRSVFVSARCTLRRKLRPVRWRLIPVGRKVRSGNGVALRSRSHRGTHRRSAFHKFFPRLPCVHCRQW